MKNLVYNLVYNWLMQMTLFCCSFR